MNELLDHINSLGDVKPFCYNGIYIEKLSRQELMNLLAHVLEKNYEFIFEYDLHQ